MKRTPMSKNSSSRVFRQTYDNGRSRPHPSRGGFRL